MSNSNIYRYHLNNAFFDSPLTFGCTQLHQLGRLYCHPTTVIKSHFHDDIFELTVITSGKGMVITNGVPTSVCEGDVYLSFPHEEHKIISDEKEPLQYDFFAFMTTDRELLANLREIQKNYTDPDKRVFRDGKLSSLVSEAITELSENQEFSHRMLAATCEQIQIRIIRAFREAEKTHYRVSESEILCYQAMSYIDAHVLDIKSLVEVSAALNYNYSYLSDLFKRSTGQTLAEYYRSRRLEVARDLLDEGSKSITKIAELLNYSSLYTFSRAFKEKYGISPNQYKLKRISSDLKTEIQ